MDKIIIGLYKHKISGEYDVMINQLNNTCICHNGDYKLIEEFTHFEKSNEEKIKDKIHFDKLKKIHLEYSELLSFERLTKNKLLIDNLQKSQERKINEILKLINKK